MHVAHVIHSGVEVGQGSKREVRPAAGGEHHAGIRSPVWWVQVFGLPAIDPKFFASRREESLTLIDVRGNLDGG